MTSSPFSEQVRALVADAYREAALKGADMRLAADCLESVRAVLLGNIDHLAGYDAINTELVRADGTTWLSVLAPFRQFWENHTAGLRIADLRELSLRDGALVWGAWLRIFSDCLSGFRMNFCRLLCEAPLTFPTDGVPAIDRVRQWLLRARQGRWNEALEMYEQLGRHPEVTPATRARLLAIAADICTFHFWEPRVAKKYLDEAQALVAEDYAVECSWGNYWLEKGDFDRADPAFANAVRLAPDRNNGLVGQAECRLKRNDVAGAEALFQQALKLAASPAEGHAAWLRLHYVPAVFAAGRERIADLVERIGYLDNNTAGHHEAHVHAGYAFEQNGDHEAAHQWYQRAIALGPEMLSGYRGEGYLYLAEGKLDLAEQYFRRLIEVAPDAFAGYLGMSALEEERGDAAAALRACQECRRRVPSWMTSVTIRLGILQQEVGQLAEADATLRGVLAGAPDSQDAVRAVEWLADEYADRKDFDAARGLLRDVRSIRGDAYEADFRARIGRLSLKQGDTVTAQAELLSALTLNPAHAQALESLHTMVDDLYKKGGDEADALGLLERIREIRGPKGYEQTYRDRVGRLHFWFGRYAEAAREFERAVEAMPTDPVLHSNLGLAWEQLVPARGLAAVEAALRAVSHASELAPDEREYQNRRERLSLLRQLGAQFGGRAIAAATGVPPLVVEFATALKDDVFVSGTTSLRAEYGSDESAIRMWCTNVYGVDLPAIQTRTAELTSPIGYVLRLYDVPVAGGEVRAGAHPCTGAKAKLDELGLETTLLDSPYNGTPIPYVKTADAARAVGAGVPLWTVPGHALLHLARIVERNLGRLVQHEWVVNKLGQYPGEAACEQILTSQAQTAALVQVLRALVTEHVPIVEFVPICSAFTARWSGSARLMDVLVSVRRSEVLKPALPGNQESSQLMTVSPKFERLIETCIVDVGPEPYLALSPIHAQEALARVREQVSAFVGAGALVAIGSVTRHFLRKLIELEFPYLWVISRDELLSGWERRVIGEITEGEGAGWLP